MYRLVLLLALLCILPSCGTPSASAPPEAPVVGVFDGPLDGHLELEIVDDVTGEPLSGTATLTLADGTTREVEAGIIDDPALVGPISITVLAGGRPQRWDGVGGAHVIFGVAHRRSGQLRGTLLLPERGVVSAQVRPLGPARLLRTEQFDRSDSVAWAFDGSFTVPAPVTASGVVAVLSGVESEPIGVALARGSASATSPAIRIDATSAVDASFAREVELPASPTGSDRVVGVPGLAIGAHVALLGYSELGHFVVPDVAGASLWLLARAEWLGGRESVVIQRGLTSLEEAGAWPAFLEVPTVAHGDVVGALVIGVPPGASVLTIDWYGGSVFTDPVASVLVIAPPSAITVAPPDLGFAPSTARVRVLDVPGVDAAALDFAAVDAQTSRYADVEVTF